MPPLTIYLADDHPAVRLGMVRLFQTFSRVGDVKEAANGKELIELVKAAVPDIVVLDLEMPVLNGLQTSKYLVQHYPQVKILILTMHSEDSYILRLIEAGVHGFLSKTAGFDEVERALYAIADRDFYRNEIVNAVLRKRAHRKSKSSSENLSARELEVLLLICQELTPAEISRRLQISEKTFFNHRSNILAKAGVRGTVGLVKYACEHQLIEISADAV